MAKEAEHKKMDGVKIGAVIILILSALVFVFFGFGTDVYTSILNRNSSVPAFGSYDGKKIEYKAGTEFAQRVQSIASAFERAGYQMNTQTEYYVFHEAFIQTVESMAYKPAVRKAGWLPADGAINRQLVTNSLFLDDDGKFSQKLYSTTDTATVTSLRSSIEEQLYLDRYADDLLGSESSLDGNALYGLKSSSAEQAFLASMGSEKHSFNLASFSTADFPKEEAAVYGRANAEKFTRYDISAVTLETKAEADTVLAQIEANELLFEDAVSEKSQGYYTDTDGKLSSPYHYQLVSTIESDDDVAAVTSLAPGQLSGVVQTRSGYTIFRADGSPVAADFADDAMQEIVLSYLRTNESGYIETYYSDIARNFIADAAINGFDNACAKFGLEKTEVPAFPINYANSDFAESNPTDVTALTTLSTNASALQTAFSLGVNEISQPFVLTSYVNVLQCTGIQTDPVQEGADFTSQIADADDTSAQSTLMHSSKLEDNFTNVFFDYMLSSATN